MQHVLPWSTHVRHIYSKLEVHSKQELLDLVEAKQTVHMRLCRKTARKQEEKQGVWARIGQGFSANFFPREGSHKKASLH